MEFSNLSPAEITRYARHLTLEGWGREAQERVKSSRILIVGAGGLGSSAALYLLAGGVGSIRLVDYARVNLMDLSHQVLYREQDLGKVKAIVAERRLKELNSFTLVEPLAKFLSPHNVSRLIAGCQVLLDATNSPAAGLVLNQAASRLQLPLVHAWVWDLNGRLTTYWPGHGPCLACSSPESSHSGSSLFSPLAGILGGACRPWKPCAFSEARGPPCLAASWFSKALSAISVKSFCRPILSVRSAEAPLPPNLLAATSEKFCDPAKPIKFF